jgi:hypothetical protein
MKIAVACESPLLQKSLELFLKKHLCVEKRCDILVKDTPCYGDKRCFCISTDKEADLIKPFSKSQLILALQKHYKKLYAPKQATQQVAKKLSTQESFAQLEAKIEQLTQEYKNNILREIKGFYEKN